MNEEAPMKTEPHTDHDPDSTAGTEAVHVVDLGALTILARSSMRLSVDAHQDGAVTDLVVRADGYQMRLDVFAASRTTPLWPRTVDGLLHALTLQGCDPQRRDGQWGAEVHARVPLHDGRRLPVLVLGIDGPAGSGWMLRATVQPDLEPDLEPVHTEPVHTEPVHSEPVHSEPVHSEPVHSEPVHSETTEPAQSTDTPAEVRRSEDTEAPEGIGSGDAPGAGTELEEIDQLDDVSVPAQLLELLETATVFRDDQPRPAGAPLPMHAPLTLLVPRGGDGRSLAEYQHEAAHAQPAVAAAAYRYLPGLRL